MPAGLLLACPLGHSSLFSCLSLLHPTFLPTPVCCASVCCAVLCHAVLCCCAVPCCAVPCCAVLLQDIFEGPSFYITLVPDVVGAEMCGTLKNIVALAAGFVEGLGYGGWAMGGAGGLAGGSAFLAVGWVAG